MSFGSNGLPVGLQIVGRPFEEEAVLALAKVLQDAYPIGLRLLLELKNYKKVKGREHV